MKREEQNRVTPVPVHHDVIDADTASLLDRLCRLTTEALGGDCSHVFLWHPRAGYTPVAAYDVSGGEWEGFRATRLPRSVEKRLVAGARDGLVDVALQEAHGSIAPAFVRLALRSGVTRSLFAVLRQGRNRIGVFHAGKRLSRAPFTSAQHRIARRIAQIAPVTLELILAEQQRRATDAEAYLDSVSREIRHPITAISGYHSLLLAQLVGPLNAEQAEFLRHAERCTTELNQLIASVLDIRRFETDPSRPRRDVGSDLATPTKRALA